MSNDLLLEVEDVDASYGDVQILRGISLAVNRGDVVSLIGRNGAGKTSTLRTIMGVIYPDRGRIRFDGEDITDTPDYGTTQRGIRLVPEDRQVYLDLTVEENLRMGSLRSSNPGGMTIEDVFEWFPRLVERRTNKGSQLSGGEQQMLVIARALLGGPKLLLLDEPTEGLAPQIVDDVLSIIEEIRNQGVTIVLVEQNVQAALAVCERHYVINKGENVFEGSTSEIESSSEMLERYLGVGV